MKSQKKRITKIIVYLVALCLIYGVSIITGVFESFSVIKNMITIKFASVVMIAIMVCFVLILGNLLQMALSCIKTKNKRVNTFITIASSLLKYVLALVIFCWGLTLLGVDIKTVFASVGLLALIVGFGAESLIADVITGLFLIFENQYNVGDIIEVDGFRGRVQNIGIRSTSIIDIGENVKIINNSAMVNILNRSTDFSKAVCDLSVPYELDLVELEEKLPDILKDIQQQHSNLFMEVPQYVGVQELAESAIVLRIVACVNEKEIYNATRILNRGLYLALKKMNIDLPYRQIEVHTK